VLTENDDRRALVQANIKINDQIVHVFSTHLSHTHQQNSVIQLQQASEVLAHIPDNSSILMGDFNAIPSSTTIEKVKEVLVDTDTHNLPTWSVYPEGCVECNPQKIDIRLDYIFTTKDITTNSYKVESSKGSDHLPISAVVEL
jgi:endonuclease/exonuclease/phosphatase family metal-dependent hydrolase